MLSASASSLDTEIWIMHLKDGVVSSQSLMPGGNGKDAVQIWTSDGVFVADQMPLARLHSQRLALFKVATSHTLDILGRLDLLLIFLCG
jgi:hypothetical protein